MTISNLTDLLIANRKEEEKYFQNYLDYAKKIKKEAEKFLGEVKVFVFGSILREDEIPRDIDILIISEKLTNSKKKSEARAKIWQRTGLFDPFELHFATPEEYQNWYRYFLKEKIEVND